MVGVRGGSMKFFGFFSLGKKVGSKYDSYKNYIIIYHMCMIFNYIHKRDIYIYRYNQLKNEKNMRHFVGSIISYYEKLPGPDGPCISEISSTDVVTFEASISC